MSDKVVSNEIASNHVDTLFKDGKLSVITFSTTDASFAIPLDQVLYIEKDVKRNIQLNELDQFNHEVITFQNQTVQLYDFNRLIGCENHQQAMQNFVSLLDNMEQQHVSWLDALEESVLNNTPFNKALDPTKCDFGRWYEQFKTDNEELAEVMERFDAPHRKLHGVAKGILSTNKTDHEQAMKMLQLERATTLSELIVLFQLAKERAKTSVRPIILFVEHGDAKITALRLDNINDIVTYNRSSFSKDDSTEGVMKNKNEDFVIEGYLRNGNEAPLMLINCRSHAATPEQAA